ncbi:FAD-binding monooxygenase [Ktedonobacteria bacterium brp13]|nr:FAD-binding monooxygenase [Ktedonobacteria bacterium brp13]
MCNETIPVLIVGAGPVGLTASLLLAHQEIRSVLVERHSGTSIHPRAKGINIRSMELFRLMGLEERIRAAGNELVDSTNWLFVETLAGREIRRVSRRSLFEPPPQLEQVSPTIGTLCAQNQLEPLLVAEAHKLGCSLRFDTELISFEQDEHGVSASVKENSTGAQYSIRANYLLAADGASSRIRHLLGISMRGTEALSYHANIYFRADLRELVHERWFSMCFVQNPEARGVLAPVNNSDLWQFHAQYHPEKGSAFEDFTPAYCVELVRKVVGLSQLDVEILSVLPWEAAMRVADHFQQDRVFLAGDAVHVMPPSGGFGLNTGVQDAHNLCWKLAAVINGPASPALLTTYETERRPVDQFTTEQAGLRIEGRGTPVQTTEQKKPERVDEIVVTIGYSYASPAVIEDDEVVPHTNMLDVSGCPGLRAPHVWLERDGIRISTIDLFDRHFVLLTGDKDTDWCETARATAARLGFSLDTYRVGGADADLVDVDGRWATAYGVLPGGAVIVRPDGFVGWRTKRFESPSQDKLEAVMRRLLCDSGSVAKTLGDT